MLTPETVAALLRAGDGTPVGRIYRLAPLTGMRLGEILGLGWTDADLERGVLYIRRSARRQTGKGVVMGNTKTARSSRPVPLASDVVALLKLHRQEQRTATLQMLANYRDDGLVFCKENGDPFDGVYVSHCWRQLTRRMGVKARFHDLRHAFATFALKGGVPVKVVSEILGQSTTAITENLYTSVLPGLKEDAVSAVASLLSQATVSDALEAAK
jgi:integrase